MPSGDGLPYALHQITTQRLPAGTRLAHCHPLDPATGHWPFDAFNAASRARFAGHLATPPRGAWYGGSLAACALWETYLRHVRPNADGTVALSRARLRHARLAHVLTTRELRLIPLIPMLLHAMHQRGEAGTNVWSALTTGSDYDETHAAAAYLLQRARELGVTVDGFV